MSAQTELFPFAPLDTVDETRILAMCGSIANIPPRLEIFRRFLATSGFNGLPLPSYREFVRTLGADCLEALEITAESAPRNLYRSALFYAGVASEIVGSQPTARHKVPSFSPLPRHKETLLRVRDMDRMNLALTALQSADEIPPSFDHMMDQLRGIYVAEDGNVGMQAARLGVGLLHLITVCSHDSLASEAIGPDEPDQFDGLFTSLESDEGLKQIFKETEWPDQLS